MEIFAFVTLIVLFLSIQHLLNWMWRKTDDDTIIGCVIVSIVLIILSVVIIKFIIKWGYPVLF